MKEIDSGDEPAGDTAPMNMLRQMQAALLESMSGTITEEQAASILTQYVGQTAIFNEETVAMFKTRIRSAFEKMSGETRDMPGELDKPNSDT